MQLTAWVIALVVAATQVARAQPGAMPATEPAAEPPEPAEPEAEVSAVATDPGEPVTGTVRGGVYADSDKTTVWRLLGGIAHSYGQWDLSAGFGIDAVTSASVDVRSSPVLSKVDTVTSASGRSSTSGGQMTDQRYQGTFGAGWKGSEGKALGLSGALAKESDYASASGGINGSFDVLDRTTTILGGISVTDNRISSVIDSTIHRKMVAVAWSAGVARVLTPDDAIRVRYDGKYAEGYLASPYRSVRFGDWTAVLGDQQITFQNATAVLAELEPDHRLSSALSAEWVHSLALGVGIHPEVRVSHDSFGVESLSAGVDLRISRPSWRMRTGYRYYTQSAASFFEDKYTSAPMTYAYYTSDKELGTQVGHLGQLDLGIVLIDAESAADSRLLLDLQIDAVHYTYPGFVLLPSRDSVFASVGLSWEL